mgnify:CR=1 FL=1
MKDLVGDLEDGTAADRHATLIQLTAGDGANNRAGMSETQSLWLVLALALPLGLCACGASGVAQHDDVPLNPIVIEAVRRVE